LGIGSLPVARLRLQLRLVGLETTRGWKEKTVLRMAPCLFGLVANLFGN
jgi:hypothetical protein